MAKKKTEDATTVEEGLDVRTGENASEDENATAKSENTPEAPAEEKKSRASNKTSEGKTTTAQSEDIPEDVKAVLKCFPNEEELYVSRYGGTFPKDSEPFVRGNAILYKNPFYKS